MSLEEVTKAFYGKNAHTDVFFVFNLITNAMHTSRSSFIVSNVLF